MGRPLAVQLIRSKLVFCFDNFRKSTEALSKFGAISNDLITLICLFTLLTAIYIISD